MLPLMGAVYLALFLELLTSRFTSVPLLPPLMGITLDELIEKVSDGIVRITKALSKYSLDIYNKAIEASKGSY
jgi:hypothetical protein